MKIVEEIETVNYIIILKIKESKLEIIIFFGLSNFPHFLMMAVMFKNLFSNVLTFL